MEMNNLASQEKPSQITTIGIFHLVSGIVNLMGGVSWFLLGFLKGMLTLGIGCIFCIPAFLMLPLGIMEIISGAKHLSPNPRNLSPPSALAVVQCVAVMAGNPLSLASGIVTLTMINAPEIKRYYDQSCQPSTRLQDLS